MKKLIDDRCDILEYPLNEELSIIFNKLLNDYPPQDVLMYTNKLFDIELRKLNFDKMWG